jgi:LPXTG-motif cell wall-anchored protein
MKIIGVMLLVIGTVAIASATPAAVPEIDASSTVGALALLSGSLLMFKSRRKK